MIIELFIKFDYFYLSTLKYVQSVLYTQLSIKQYILLINFYDKRSLTHGNN